MPSLELYFKPTCPYCFKVLNYLEHEGISVSKIDTSASLEQKQKLIEIGGKSQVPCLVIDGKALYESDDIIEWFQSNYERE